MSEKSGRAAEENDRLQQLINYGTEIAGGAAGAALGFFIGGPVGAVIGGAGGPAAAITLRNIGQEILERHLGSREKVRVGAAFTIAAADICQRIESGESLREDGFFDEKQTGRSDAEEVAESVLLKAQREPEEKKIEYMGYLLASIAFNPQISVHMAHQLSKITEQLTYQQLGILKLCTVKAGYRLRNTDYREDRISLADKDLYQALYECADLHNKEYINFGGEIASGLTNAIPSGMTLQGIGRDLFNLMKLTLIPDEDIAPIAAQLK